jgi:curli biogenesis system outer membrane secretion channel CsgG
MKHFLLIMICACFCFTSCQTSQKALSTKETAGEPEYAQELFIGPKKKMAIAKFENATRFGKRRLGENITAVLSTELAKTGRFILIERADLQEILEQVALSQTGLTEGTLEQIRLLDADYIMTGTVTKYAVTTSGTSNLFTQSKVQRAEVAADMRMIDVRTGEIILSESGEGSAEREAEKVMGMGEDSGYDESLEMDAFRAAVINLTGNVVQAIDVLPWVCDVVKISGSKLYIDSGKKSNLQTGMSFDIFSRGEAVKNLEGTIIGYEETLVGSATLVEFFGSDGAILQLEEDSGQALPLICRLKETVP